MKKRFALFLAFAVALAFTACGVKSESSSMIIEAKDCYGNAGYIEFVAGAEKSAEYTFTAENSEAVEWRVYVFDQAFDDGFRYIAQAAEPVLVGDGKISVTAGQYVYVYCSVNEFTADAADENAKVNVVVE